MKGRATVVNEQRQWSNTSADGVVRWVLKADAAVTGVNGLAYLAAAQVLDSFLGLPATLLRAVGAFLVVYAVVVWLVATRGVLVRAAVMAVIAANVIWALDSVVVAGAEWFSPSGLGRVWIVLQAVTVGGFAMAQLWSLSRSRQPGATG